MENILLDTEKKKLLSEEAKNLFKESGKLRSKGEELERKAKKLLQEGYEEKATKVDKEAQQHYDKAEELDLKAYYINKHDPEDVREENREYDKEIRKRKNSRESESRYALWKQEKDDKKKYFSKQKNKKGIDDPLGVEVGLEMSGPQTASSVSLPEENKVNTNTLPEQNTVLEEPQPLEESREEVIETGLSKPAELRELLKNVTDIQILEQNLETRNEVIKDLTVKLEAVQKEGNAVNVSYLNKLLALEQYALSVINERIKEVADEKREKDLSQKKSWWRRLFSKGE